MAKKKKFPKRPKESASLGIWERYKERCKEIKKDNDKLIADEKKKKSLISQCKKDCR